MEKFDDLRRRAQQRMTQQPAPELSGLSMQEIASLIEELHIHQTELEIQNEDLRETQLQLEASRQQYVNLYDVAPLGYFSFDPNGLILAVNLTGADQLGSVRNHLLKRPFTDYVHRTNQDTFYLHCRQVFKTGIKQSCELQLVRPDGSHFESQLESVAVVDEAGEARQIQSVLIDISERKQLQNELREERNLLRTLIDYLPAYIFVRDTQSRFIMGNLAIARLMGVQSDSELIGKTDFDFYPETWAAQYYEDDQTVIRSGQPLIDKVESLINPAGHLRWLSTTKLPLQNAAGETIGLVGISRDITEQNRYERRINLLQIITQNIGESESFHTALAGTLRNISEITNWDYGEAWTLDEEEKVLRCSPAWYSSREDLRPFREQSETLTFSFNVGLPGRIWALESPEWVPDISDASESQIIRRQLALDAGFNVALAVPFLANHRIVVVLVFFMAKASPEDEEMVDLISTIAQLGLALHRKEIQDEREQLLEAVSRQREELRALAGRLAQIQEAERQQLARELHDQVGQNLSALGFNLKTIETRLAETSAGIGPIQTQLDDSLALIEQTTDRIRNLMADLRPPMLDEYGLVDALEWYADRFTARTDVPVEIHNEMLATRLPISTEAALFRIAQEALTNIAKYARAKQVTMALTEEEETVRLVIADDGVGFDPVEVDGDKERQNLGLLTMRERALAVGGHSLIEAQPGRGTRVTVEVPR